MSNFDNYFKYFFKDKQITFLQNKNLNVKTYMYYTKNFKINQTKLNPHEQLKCFFVGYKFLNSYPFLVHIFQCILYMTCICKVSACINLMKFYES